MPDQSIHEWLERLPGPEDAAPVVPGFKLILGEHQDDLAEQVREASGQNPVAGLFAAIEYLAADDTLTRRRITMKRLARESSGIMLYATCHEREAFRVFRLDRVRCFIDRDGVIHDPVDWWRDMGVDPDAAADGYWKTRVKALESALGDQLVLLCALAAADGEASSAEQAAIVEHVAEEMERAGAWVDDVAAAELRTRVRRSRPLREEATGAVERLFGQTFPRNRNQLDPRARRRFLNAARKVVDADGRIDAGEMALLIELAKAIGE